MNMKSVLLIGLGRFGRHIAYKLNEMNHEVMAVDKMRNVFLPSLIMLQVHRSEIVQNVSFCSPSA